MIKDKLLINNIITVIAITFPYLSYRHEGFET